MILVVDDDSGIQELLCELLEKHGHECRSCGSVPQALSLLQKEQFELVVLDLNLKSGKGVSIEQYMRKQGSPHIKTPSLFISGHSEMLDLLPADATKLSKPFKNEDFLSVVESLLKGERAPVRKEKQAKKINPSLEKILKGS